MRILVLDVPALHLGYLGCYGNDWVATPNIDRLAADGVVFDQHYYDVERSLHSNLAANLEAMGLSQRFVAGQGNVTIDNLLDTVADTKRALEDGAALTWLRFPTLAPPWDLPGDMLDSYCEDDETPWPDPPHGPIDSASDLIRLQNTYAAALTCVDGQLGAVLDDLPDDTLVCLHTAHGLPLGEHGQIGFTRACVNEQFAHLPLVLRLPGRAHAGLRIGALTQPVDLVPTLVGYLASQAGAGLWPLIRGDVDRVREHALTEVRVAETTLRAVRTLDWALIESGAEGAEPGLFVKPDDRWEVNDVRQHHPELVDELKKVMGRPAVCS